MHLAAINRRQEKVTQLLLEAELSGIVKKEAETKQRVYPDSIALALASPFGRRQWGVDTGNSRSHSCQANRGIRSMIYRLLSLTLRQSAVTLTAFL
ncbi:MAG TPA: hypothetical protein VE956_02205 [Nodularia sp. (in: cyanobacteria)]|nr:hypothetical protein [Nodularia sp. (in: cyanobacteria)]